MEKDRPGWVRNYQTPRLTRSYRRQPEQQTRHLLKLQRDTGIAKEIFFGALASDEDPFAGVKADNLARVYRNHQNGPQPRQRFQPRFIGSLDQDSLLKPLPSFRPAIVNRAQGPQGLKLLIS